jgi:HD-GYP domain-containing protein (c-di-GMP phosphodiesterase class II)
MALRMSQMLRNGKELRTRTASAGLASRTTGSAASAKAAQAAAEERADRAAIAPLIEQGEVDELTTIQDDPQQAPDSVSAQLHGSLVQAALSVLAASAQQHAPDGPSTVAAVRGVLEDLKNGDELLAVTVRSRHADDSWAKRSANATILALKLGLELEYDDRKALALGLCGLMHDIGMLSIPEEVLSERRFNPEQLALLHRHPEESQRMVQSFGKAFSWIGKVVVQVHERQDGSGYPRGLKGEEIHEFARIIGIVDTYEAMAHPRADREARVVYNALKEIIDLRNSLFDPALIKALIYIVSIFPLGSLVKLNNGEVGRVVGTSRLHPTRPTVDVLLDPRGRKMREHRQMNLGDEPMLYIVDPAIEEGVLEQAGN